MRTNAARGGVLGVLLGGLLLSTAACSGGNTTTTAAGSGSQAPATTAKPDGAGDQDRERSTRTTRRASRSGTGSTTPVRSFPLGEAELGEDGGEVSGAKVSCQGTEDSFTIDVKGDDDSSMTVTVDNPALGAANDLRYEPAGGDAIDGRGSVAARFRKGDSGASSASFIVRSSLEVDGQDKEIIAQGSCVLEGTTRRSTTTTASSATGPLTPPVTDAQAYASTMVRLAIGAGRKTEEIHAAWKNAGLPSNGAVGSALEATPERVSGFALVASKKAAQDVLPFAVKDTKGTCALGYLYEDPEGDYAGKVSVQDVPECTGNAALAAFEADDDL